MEFQHNPKIKNKGKRIPTTHIWPDWCLEATTKHSKTRAHGPVLPAATKNLKINGGRSSWALKSNSVTFFLLSTAPAPSNVLKSLKSCWMEFLVRRSRMYAGDGGGGSKNIYIHPPTCGVSDRRFKHRVVLWGPGSWPRTLILRLEMIFSNSVSNPHNSHAMGSFVPDNSLRL